MRPCSRRNSLSRVVEEDLLPTEEAAMANSDDSYPTNADVIQGGRAIRSNPVLLAALMSSPDDSQAQTRMLPWARTTSPDRRAERLKSSGGSIRPRPQGERADLRRRHPRDRGPYGQG